MNFTLTTQDVLHSFWVPQLGGKRDLITNHPNYLWYTPDSVGRDGVQRLLCRVLRRVAREHALQDVHGDAGGLRAVGGASGDARRVRRRGARRSDGARPPAPAPAVATRRHGAAAPQPQPQRAAAAPAPAAAVATDTAAAPRRRCSRRATSYPREKLPAWTVPKTPMPAGLTFNNALVGKRRPRTQAAVDRTGRLRRLPHDQRQPGDDGRDRPEPHARRQPHDDRRRDSIRTTRSISRSGSRTRVR